MTLIHRKNLIANFDILFSQMFSKNSTLAKISEKITNFQYLDVLPALLFTKH
jgi:hypothetical protein